MTANHENNRIYYLDEHQQLMAEVTFPEVGTDTVNIDHTYVHPSLSGQGIAGKLMEQVVMTLQQQHKKARLTCSYAVKWFEKHPEHQDLVE